MFSNDKGSFTRLTARESAALDANQQSPPTSALSSVKTNTPGISRSSRSFPVITGDTSLSSRTQPVSCASTDNVHISSSMTTSVQSATQKRFSVANWIGMPHAQLNDFIASLAVYQYKVAQRAQEGKKRWMWIRSGKKSVLPALPVFRARNYELITDLRDGVDVGTGLRPHGGGYKSRQIGAWCVDVEREEGDIGTQKQGQSTAMEKFALDNDTVPSGTESEEEMAVGCNALSAAPSDADSQIGTEQCYTKPTTEHLQFDSAAMNLRNQVLHGVPMLEMQTARLDACAASLRDLPEELGDTKAWIQYQAVKALGGQLVDSESIFSLPRWLGIKEEVGRSACRIPIAFLSVSDLVLAKLLANEFHAESLEGLRLYTDLARALTLSDWLCAIPSQLQSRATSTTGYTQEHDSTTCYCSIKARRVIVCAVLLGAVYKNGDEMTVRKGFGGGVVPVRVEMFAWGRELQEVRVGQFATWVRGEVERGEG